MKKSLLLAAVMAMGTPVAAQAQGIPVYDNTSTLQLIAQVKNTLQQIQQGEQMISQATATYNSLSKLTQAGSIAAVLNDPNVSQLLPSGVTDVAKLAQADVNALGNFGSAANTINGGFTIQTSLGQNGTLNSQVSQAYSQYLKTTNQGASVAAALGYNVSTQSSQVDTGLDQLRQSIATAQDPKDSMDLNARATIESAKISNRLLQLTAMQQYYNSMERMRYNQYRLNKAAAQQASDNALMQSNSQQWTGY